MHAENIIVFERKIGILTFFNSKADINIFADLVETRCLLLVSIGFISKSLYSYDLTHDF